MVWALVRALLLSWESWWYWCILLLGLLARCVQAINVLSITWRWTYIMRRRWTSSLDHMRAVLPIAKQNSRPLSHSVSMISSKKRRSPYWEACWTSRKRLLRKWWYVHLQFIFVTFPLYSIRHRKTICSVFQRKRSWWVVAETQNSSYWLVQDDEIIGEVSMNDCCVNDRWAM